MMAGKFRGMPMTVKLVKTQRKPAIVIRIPLHDVRPDEFSLWEQFVRNFISEAVDGRKLRKLIKEMQDVLNTINP